MLDIITSLFESIVSFLETLIEFVGFVINNVSSLFNVFNYIPTLFRGPLIMALSIIIVLGVKKGVLA